MNSSEAGGFALMSWKDKELRGPLVSVGGWGVKFYPPAQQPDLKHVPFEPQLLGQAWPAHHRCSVNLQEAVSWG